MARFGELLRDRLPDVYEGLLAAGAAEAPVGAQLPAALAGSPACPGDGRLTMLATRRTTIDWVLGNIAADLVVDATGRRSPIDRWLAEVGGQPTATWRAECGLAYFSRHYRLRPGAKLPGAATTRILAGLDEFTAGIWPADNGAMRLAAAPLAGDRRFSGLTSPAAFTAVLRTVPACAPWLDVLDPISRVYPMAGLHTTLRRLVGRWPPDCMPSATRCARLIRRSAAGSASPCPASRTCST